MSISFDCFICSDCGERSEEHPCELCAVYDSQTGEL